MPSWRAGVGFGELGHGAGLSVGIGARPLGDDTLAQGGLQGHAEASVRCRISYGRRG
jgi:hypothetical protein